MNDTEKILEAIGVLQSQMTTMQNQMGSMETKMGTMENRMMTMQDQLNSQGKDISDLKQGQARLETAVEALAEGQKDIREQLDQKTDKAEIRELRLAVTKKVKDYEKRIVTIEDDLDLHNKN